MRHDNERRQKKRQEAELSDLKKHQSIDLSVKKQKSVDSFTESEMEIVKVPEQDQIKKSVVQSPIVGENAAQSPSPEHGYSHQEKTRPSHASNQFGKNENETSRDLSHSRENGSEPEVAVRLNGCSYQVDELDV